MKPSKKEKAGQTTEAEAAAVAETPDPVAEAPADAVEEAAAAEESEAAKDEPLEKAADEAPAPAEEVPAADEPEKESDAGTSEEQPPEGAPQEEAGTEPAAEKSLDPAADDEQPADVAAKDDGDNEPVDASEETVTRYQGGAKLGGIDVRIGLVLMDSVLDLLGESGRERIASSATLPAVSDLAKVMLTTDGRYTPVVFSGSGDERPTLLSGYKEIAAAKVSGLTQIRAIIVHPDDAAYAQSFIASKKLSITVDEDEELLFSVMRDDDE